MQTSLSEWFYMYRGTCLQWLDFPTDVHAHVEAATIPTVMHSPQQWTQKPRNRLAAMTFNSSGLTTTKYNDLLDWLQMTAVDCAVVAETHWKFTSEWATPHYWCIHSGSQHASDGVLICIARRLCPSQCITWKDHIPGRLVHVKLAYKSKCIDVLGCYQ